MKSFLSFLAILIFLSTSQIFSQEKNKGVFEEPKEGFYKEIQKGIDEFNNPTKEKKKSFKLDFAGMNYPKSKEEFKYFWHNDPVSQGQTGTCWSFSTTSFFESEVYRLTGKKVNISSIFTAYWEYVEKVKEFVRTRGKSIVEEGSEANAVIRIYKEYGVVPAAACTGLLPGQQFHDHSEMINELQTYLKNVKTTNAWNEDEVVAVTKSILNYYLGVPPTEVVVDGKKYTPKEYLTNYLKFNVDDYVDVVSYMQQPYWQQVEYEVPDNWWHNKDYYNIPLDDFMKVLKNAIKNGYTLAIGGDVSEPGYDSWTKCAVVPTFDIPSEYIDENSRQFRFSNETTTDDHGIHLVGYKELDGKTWFLIKDSGSGSRNTGDKGYYFYQEDYVKLKIMDFMVHKDMFKDYLSKFTK
ncbi:MAG: peptidase C1 [Ignavibacteriaceae bacterium]|nr:peptidase C1 [Ignavibacterium sp.]MCC6254530.1 peptidase C1 [Ignavibacteriaceae bacterium]HRN27853.1 C1 family peptidase [Ignavibacteriaceae bacterium]HRP94023.1 C1 family peptidase [Ignavibacteriaceae bacterium]HRQ55154.1 C1 family peptidase [Ignavibacteriaceae bacterium]